jgi:hypothetical protein
LIQTTFAPQAPFQLSHLTVVGLVIVTQEVQKAVEGQDSKLNRKRMPLFPSLPRRDAGSYRDVAQRPTRLAK